VKRRSPEDRQKDVDDITDWIRKGRPGDADSPTNEFATIDQMLPPKKNQSPDDRAKDVEGVLNWMRSNNITSVLSIDDAMPLSIDNLPSVPLKRRSPEDRQKDIDDITDWIRKGRPIVVDSPTNEFAIIDEILPPQINQRPHERAREIESSLNWCRISCYDPKQSCFSSYSDLLVLDDANSLNDILLWMRNDKDSLDDKMDKIFRVVDNVLSHKHGESPFDRAKKIDNVISFMRNMSLPIEEDIINTENFFQKGLSNRVIKKTRRTKRGATKNLGLDTTWQNRDG
jgi:hypothetical protein